jgi:hypothetical protein
MGSFNTVLLFLLFIILICIIANIITHCVNGGYFVAGNHCINGGQNHIKHLSRKTDSENKGQRAAMHLGKSMPMSAIMLMSNSETEGQRASKAQIVMNPIFPGLAMTYTISGEGNGLNYSILRQMFKKNGDTHGITWIEKPVSEKVNASFGSFGGFSNKKASNLNLSPNFYKQSASIKNVLDGHSGFINKTELYATIKRLIPNGIKYIPATYTVSEFQNLGKDSFGKAFPKGLAILKKNFSCKQQGVKVIESMSDYYNAKKELDIKEDGIISEYITNPLLLDGKKIHLRIYYLLSIISGITKCSAYHEYRIYISEEKYVKGDWLNPKIHISGVNGKLTNRRYYWPDDISAHYDIKHINKQTNQLIH